MFITATEEAQVHVKIDPKSVVIDLVGELDTTMSRMLNREINGLDSSSCGTVVVRLERLESTQWAGLCDLAAVIDRHRRAGRDVRAQSRLRRVIALLDEFAIPHDGPDDGALPMRRRLIIARNPQPKVA